MENAEAETESYKETAVRSMVYHEVSHAILTPPELMEIGKLYIPTGIINIFEDERIETLLKDFYMDVNFKQNLLYICGNTIPPATNSAQVFFNLVRFRCYKDKEIVEEVEQIIENFKTLSCTTTSNGVDYYTIRAYIRAIRDLYEEICDSEVDSATPSAEEIKEIVQEIQNSTTSQDGYKENKNTADKSQISKDTKEDSTAKIAEDSDAEAEDSDAEAEENSDLEAEENDEKSTGGGGRKNNTLFDEILNQFRNSAITEQFKQIVSNFNKKTGSGNGCTGYSGIFNPRNIKNNDYKFFDKKINSNGNNKFGKIHLNLFIDESGSFRYLEDSANRLINSLAEVERTNPNFDFDLICDSVGFREKPKNQRKIHSDGDNLLSYKEVIEIMKKHTKKDCYNYNIVLHDGWVITKENKNCFLGWDRNNVSIIDTGDNSVNLSEVKQAKVYICPYNELVNTLETVVLNIFKRAFN